MKLKEFVKVLGNNTKIEVVDIYNKLMYIGRSYDIEEEDFPKTLNSIVIKVLEVKDNYLKILVGI